MDYGNCRSSRALSASEIRTVSRAAASWPQTCHKSALMRNGNSSFKAVKLWYPIELPICYEGPEGSLLQGNGTTMAMSSAVIQFACDRNLPVGHVFQLWLQWPAKLFDGTSLSFWATGTIQRSACCEVEVAVRRHEFRTRRAGASKPEIMQVRQAAG